MLSFRGGRQRSMTTVVGALEIGIAVPRVCSHSPGTARGAESASETMRYTASQLKRLTCVLYYTCHSCAYQWIQCWCPVVEHQMGHPLRGPLLQLLDGRVPVSETPSSRRGRSRPADSRAEAPMSQYSEVRRRHWR